MTAIPRTSAQHRQYRRQGLPILPYYAVLVILAVFAIGPVLVLFMNSLKSRAEITTNPIGLPGHLDLGNYLHAWREGNFAVTMRNSAILTAGTIAGVCIVAGLAAYALGRLHVRFSGGLVLYLFVCSAVPFQLFLVPLFFLWSRLCLNNTLPGLILIYCAIYSPFATLLMRSYFAALPGDFEEAARVDGANEIQILLRVILPLTWPAFLTAALVAGLATWNEFFFAVTFIQSDSLKPVTTSFLAFQDQFGQDGALTSAAGVLVILPVVVLFLLLQRRFVAGLAAGGLKG